MRYFSTTAKKLNRVHCLIKEVAASFLSLNSVYSFSIQLRTAIIQFSTCKLMRHFLAVLIPSTASRNVDGGSLFHHYHTPIVPHYLSPQTHHK